jgi:hypothetical protein
VYQVIGDNTDAERNNDHCNRAYEKKYVCFYNTGEHVLILPVSRISSKGYGVNDA